MGKSPTKNSIPKNKKEFNEFRENDAFDEKLKKTRERFLLCCSLGWGLTGGAFVRYGTPLYLLRQAQTNFLRIPRSNEKN